MARGVADREKAAVLPSAAAGVLTLEAKERRVRLSWAAGSDPRERWVEPGTWTVRDTWTLRAREGVEWVLSCSGAPEGPFEAKAGETAPVALEEVVRFSGRARREGKGLALEFSLKGDRGRGVSVWKAWKRVPVRWRVLGKDGKEIAAGAANYG